jgi:hypothetical protein
MPNRYHDPDHIRSTDLGESTYNNIPGKSEGGLLSMAGSMFKFALGMAVFRKATGSMARGLFKKMSTSSVAHTKAWARRTATRMGIGQALSSEEIYGKVAKSGLWSTLRATAAEAPANSSNWIKAMSAKARMSYEVGKHARVVNKRMQESGITALKRTAKLGSYMYKHMPSYASFYAAERMGVFGQHEEKPAWYNIPGNVADFAKTTAEFALFDIAAFKGIPAAFGALKRGVSSVVKNRLNIKAAPELHRFADKHLNKGGSGFMRHVMKNVNKIGYARDVLRHTSQQFNKSFMKNFGRSAQRAEQRGVDDNLLSGKFWKNTLAHAKSQALSRYKSRWQDWMASDNNVSEVGKMLYTAVERASGMKGGTIKAAKDYKGMVNFFDDATPFSTEYLKDVSTYMHKLDLKSTMGNKVLGRSLATTRDVLTKKDKSFYRNMFKRMKDMTHERMGAAEVGNIENQFFKMYAGRSIFKKGRSGVVDYSMYEPKNLLFSAYNFFNTAFSFKMPFLKEPLKPLEILGVSRLLGKKGLATHSFGFDEEFYYKEMVGGHKGEWQSTSLFNETKAKGGLGGVFMDGSLYVTDGGVESLRKVTGANFRLIPSTAHGRHSMTAKMVASNPKVKELVDLAGRRDIQGNKIAGKGMLDKMMKIGDNISNKFSLNMPPLMRSFLNKAQDGLGIGPRTAMFKEEAEYLLGHKNLDGMQMSHLLNDVFSMGEAASKNAYFDITQPKVLRLLGELSDKRSKTLGTRFKKLAKLQEGSADRDVVRMAKTYLDRDVDAQRIIRSFELGNQRSLSRPATIGRRFEATHLSRRDELMRKLTADGMSNMGLVEQVSGQEYAFNLARELRKTPMFRDFSRNTQKDLAMMEMTVDLHQVGHSARAPFSAKNQTVMKKAVDILRKNHSDKREVLLEHLQMRPSRDFGSMLSAGLRDDYYNEGTKRMKQAFLESQENAFSINPNATTASPYLAIQKGSGAPYMMQYYADRLMEMGNFFGLRYGMKERISDQYVGFKLPEKLPLVGGLNPKFQVGSGGKWMMKRVAQTIGVMSAYQAADAFTDVNPLFAGTILDEGISVAAAETAMRGSLAFHKVKDLFGATSAAKHLEGLLPSSTTTIPGAIVGGMMWGPLGIPAGALLNRLASPVMPDLDKSYEEMKEIYSGRELVPVRKGRFWIFSKSGYEGGGVERFHPHFFARVKSQYKHTETLYGSKAEAFLYKPWPLLGVNPLGHFIDKYHYEKKHFHTRPYPYSAPAFSEIPIIGPLLGATVGSLPIIGKPPKAMHQEEIAHYYGTDGTTHRFGELAQSSMPAPSQMEQLAYMEKAYNPNSSARTELRGGPSRYINPHGLMNLMGQQSYNFTEAAGFAGFATESMMGGHPYDISPRFSTTKEMWSARRMYWDMDLGDIGFTQEFIRRFVPKEKKIWEKVNPLRNRMPGWVPGEDYFINMQIGDPYAKIKEGEIRLPGAAYSTLYDVQHSMPSRASDLGKRLGDITRRFIGLAAPSDIEQEEMMEEGTQIHREIQRNLLQANVAIKEEAMVYDPYNDMMGYVDVVLRDNTQRNGRAMEIKTVHGEKFAKLTGPIPSHVSQLNFYLRQLQGKVGTLLYINRDDPSQIRTFDVRYSEERFRRDMLNVTKARQIAAGIIANGEGYEDGSSYSHMDRLRILGDVAPYSDKYKRELKVVQTQMRAGKLTEQQIAEFQKIRKHREAVVRKYDLYPLRFAGKVFHPDSEYELMTQNENIKAASEYSLAERAIGSVWERWLHLNTPIHTRFWQYRTPLEHYKRTRLYGNEMAFWSKPYQDMIKPMFREAAAASTPLEGITSFGWLGYLGLGGMGGGAFTGLAGSLLGGAYGGGRYLTGADEELWIPDEVKRKREIERDFDRLKYIRDTNLYHLTGKKEHLDDAEKTMYSIRQKGYEASPIQAIRSLNAMEKPYFFAWSGERDLQERERILSAVPRDVANLLKVQWNRKNRKHSEEVVSPKPKYEIDVPGEEEDAFMESIPRSDWAGWTTGEEFSDIKVKSIENEGFDAHQFGLGWYDQQRRIATSPYKLSPMEVGNDDPLYEPDFDTAGLRRMLMSALSSVSRNPLVHISANTGSYDNTTRIQLNITRDRTRELQSELRGY